MSQAQNTHTPGPWSVSELEARGEPSEFYIFIEPGVAVIERKVKGHDGCDMPDAHLIAAAPELLEALEDALADLEYLAKAPDSAYARPDDGSISAARAAIAKATGAQP